MPHGRKRSNKSKQKRSEQYFSDITRDSDPVIIEEERSWVGELNLGDENKDSRSRGKSSKK